MGMRLSLVHPAKLLLCCLHWQNVFLSQSHITLGNIPVQSKCSRLLFLNNVSKNETVVFAWQPRPLDFGEVGVLAPTKSEPPAGTGWIPPQPISLHAIQSHLASFRFILPRPIPSNPIPEKLQKFLSQIDRYL